MARRSLKPQLNQIRTWAREGRTDAWIAHQLEVSVKDIATFKRDHDLAPDDDADGDAGSPGADLGEPDLRAEDDALVAAELEAELEVSEAEAEDRPADEDEEPEPGGEDSDAEPPRRRRRGRRGGRGRRRGGRSRELEGTFDHGADGYGLWLDPAVQDDPVYAEHWAGHRPVTVAIEADRIVIRRSGEDGSGSDDAGDE